MPLTADGKDRSSRSLELSIVLPCYNERDNLPLLADRFARFWPEYEFELILVNNGSTDGSGLVIAGLCADPQFPFIRIVQVEKNIGYGYGLWSGLQAAKATVLAYTHADMQTPPEDVFKAFDLYRHQANSNVLVKGRRVNRAQDAVKFTNALTKATELVLGHRMEDMNGQPKLFRRELLDRMTNPPRGFAFDLYVMYRSYTSGWEVIEFPVDFGARVYGRSSWAGSRLSRYKTILGYLRSIMQVAMAHFGEKGNLLRQIASFLGIGLLTNAANYLTFFLLLRLANVPYVLSSTAGFMAGFFVGFPLNRDITFKEARGRFGKQLAKYYVVNLISLGVNAFTITASTELLHIQPEISQLVAILVSTVVNFTGSKFWAFRA